MSGLLRYIRISIVGKLCFFGLVMSACGDLGPVKPWDCCPGQEVFDSPGGDLTLDVGDRALYCAIPPTPGPDPASVLSRLSRLLLIEGEYQVPAESGSWPVRLPLCLQLPDPDPELALDETGTLRVDHRSETYGNILRAWYDQNLLGPAGDTWLLTGQINVLYEGSLPPVKFDGSYTSGVAFGLQGPLDEWGAPMLGCGREPSPDDFVTATFSGGHVNLRVEVVAVSMAGGVPSGFLRSANGILDGTEFYQSDYWSLAYVGGHHGWVNDYFLRFDQPIGQACGMWVTDSRYPEFSATVRLLDCDLGVLEER
jgi:hypothetical protein